MNKPTPFKLRKKHLLAKAQQGFSLVELLVVIAVIGIIAAIAIPNIAGITGAADTAKTQRNAQSIASAIASAKASGATNTFTTVDDAVDAATTTNGLSGTGNFTGSSFYVPLSASEISNVKAATNLLSIQNGTLVYTTP